jgi:hypothetical protein
MAEKKTPAAAMNPAMMSAIQRIKDELAQPAPAPVQAPVVAEAPKVEAPKVEAPSAPMSEDTKRLLGEAIIGLAPILAGAAFGGRSGGAIGAQAGLGGIQKLEEGRQRQAVQEREATRIAQEQRLKGLELAFKLGTEQRLQAKEERLAASEDRKAAADEKKQQVQTYALLQNLGISKEKLDLEKKALEQKASVEKQLPAGQFAAGTYARRLEQAESIFGQLENQGYDRASLKEGIKAILPARVADSALKAQTQAERNFINALLRRESGAAISEGEFANAEAQYFPRAGDNSEIVAQKRANRQQALLGLQAEAGKALEKIPLVAVQAPKIQKSKRGIQEAVAAPSMPDFSKMSDAELQKYLGQ